jgi:hypothetical protein
VVDDWQLSQDFGVSLLLREENPEIYELAVEDYLPKSGSATVATPEPVEPVAASAVTAETAGAVGAYDAAALAALEARIAALEP